MSPAAWTAKLTCDACTYRTRLEAGCTRICPACGATLRIELKRHARPAEPRTEPKPYRPRRPPARPRVDLRSELD